MNTFTPIMALALTAALGDCPLGAPAQQLEEAGHVLEIRCEAYLKRPNAPEQPQLNAKRDRGLKLYALDQLKCYGEGYIKLEIYGRTHSIDQSHGWYPIPEKYSGNDSGPAAGRTSELKGTYKLFQASTPISDALATEQVKRSTHWLLFLQTPAEMAIDIDGKTVTIASSTFPEVAFLADGIERQEISDEGNAIRSLALVEGGQLTIKSRTTLAVGVETVFLPQTDGELQVVSRFYSDVNKPPTITEALYHRTSYLAHFDVLSALRTAENAPGGDFVFQEGRRVVGRLDETISMNSVKVGDEFSLTVYEPNEYEGAKVKGHISHVRGANEQAVLTLTLDSIHLVDGRSYSLAGAIDEIHGDENIRMGARPSLGEAVGAILGTIPNAGAAIGNSSRAPNPACTIYVNGAGELKLSKGTEITIRVQTIVP